MSLASSARFERQYLWIQVCEQLKCHNKGDDCCIDTLNRLWRKHPCVKTNTAELLLDVPLLPEEMLMVKIEHWPLERLVALNPPHERNQLRSFAPIIVLHWFDQYFLLDGNTRVNYWKKVSNRGPHAVLEITTANGDI